MGIDLKGKVIGKGLSQRNDGRYDLYTHVIKKQKFKN